MRSPPKNVPPKGISQQTPEQEIEEISVNQIISSVDDLIQNENIGNDTIATLFAENSHAEKNVLLQTSQAFVSSVNSMSKGQRRVLFDNCSQKCFVTNNVKEQLKLPVIKVKIEQKSICNDEFTRFWEIENSKKWKTLVCQNLFKK